MIDIYDDFSWRVFSTSKKVSRTLRVASTIK